MDKDTLTDQNLCPRIIPHQATLEPKLSLRQIYSGFTAAAYCLLKSQGVNFSLSKNLRQQQNAISCSKKKGVQRARLTNSAKIISRKKVI
jgi:hypothetical protein